jgi:hypothetical protein
MIGHSMQIDRYLLQYISATNAGSTVVGIAVGNKDFSTLPEYITKIN